jgi:CRP-like cAMP-binding protein
MAISQSANELLAALPPPDFDLLLPHLRTIELRFGQVLIEAGAPFEQIYFPLGGIVSSVVRLRKGETIEVAAIGRDGVVGSCAVHETLASTAAIVRFPSTASVVEVAHFRAAAERSGVLRGALLRYQWLRTIRTEQIAACNAAHSAEARLCRRLLQSHDMAGSDCMLLGQDLMAQMLGVKRNTISLIAHALQAQGVIRYSRGRLAITDVDGLRQRSCECYAADLGSHAPAEPMRPGLIPPPSAAECTQPQRMPS